MFVQLKSSKNQIEKQSLLMVRGTRKKRDMGIKHKPFDYDSIHVTLRYG